jgi:hypothetical protein
MLMRVVPLALLREFDLFFNQRERPLFKIRFHNRGSGDHRHSTLDVLFDDLAKGYASQLRDGQPKDLGQLEIDLPGPFNPDFYFPDLVSWNLGQPASAGLCLFAAGLNLRRGVLYYRIISQRSRSSLCRPTSNTSESTSAPMVA